MISYLFFVTCCYYLLMKIQFPIFIFYFLVNTLSLNFRLTRHRQSCFTIEGNNQYEFQYISSGENQENVACLIYDEGQIIMNISGKSQFETVFQLKGNKGKICFMGLDNSQKVISFDFIQTDDPLKNHFSEKEKAQSHSLLYQAYAEMNKVYRDQHFILQRKQVHDTVQGQAQAKLYITFIVKIIMLITTAVAQILLIMKILESPKPQQQL